MGELGIPDNQIGQPDYDGDGHWRSRDVNRHRGGVRIRQVRSSTQES